MGWKDWPSWVKGGVILSGVFFFLSLLAIIYAFTCEREFCVFVLIFLEIPLFYFININSNFWIIWIINIIIFFIIGALIGLVVGKIKSRREDGKK